MGKKKRIIGYRQVFLILCTIFWISYPFIARIVLKRISAVEQSYFSSNEGIVIDIFLYCKELSLLVFSIVALLYFLGERVFPDKVEPFDKVRMRRLKFPYIFLGIYLLFGIISFIFSEYKETALWGVNSEYEGLIAIICYCFVFVFFSYYMKRGKEKETLLNGVVILKYGIHILCILIGILSIIEVFYKPLLEIRFLQDLISPDKYSEIAHNIKNENFIGQICLSFNNPGFLGSFCALFIPVNFALSQGGGKVSKVLGITGTALLSLPLVWSNSRVALIAVIIFLPVCLFFLIKGRRKDQILRICRDFAITVTAGILIIVLSYVLPTYASRVRQEDTGVKTLAEEPLYKLSKAEIKEGELYLYSGDVLLKVSVDKEELKNELLKGKYFDYSKCLIFSDGKDIITGRVQATLKATNIRGEKHGFSLDDERYRAVKICVENQLVIIDFGYSGSVEFYIREDGIKLFGQGSELLDAIPQPRVTGLEKIYSFGTGRGYIWAQTLPIIWDSLFIGKGNGTFAFCFRQNEIVGLLNTHGSCKYVIDRPHNWYIQIAVSNGVVALAAVVALFIWYIVIFLKSTFLKDKDGKGIAVDFLDAGLFAGLVAFMLCGMINDSCITVNPWFWVLFGTAVARKV